MFGVISDRAYLAMFRAARSAAFTRQEAASLLARIPTTCGTLRYQPGSTPLATRLVATWAGHSVGVLHRVYAKCIAGKEAENMRRILEATAPAG